MRTPQHQNLPAWARRVVNQVVAEYGPLAHPGPSVQWRRSKVKRHTSGRTWAHADRIVITAGSDRSQHKWILLHEMAHWLAGPGHHHDDTFWDAAYELYRTFGVYRLATRYESRSLVAARRRALAQRAA